MTHQFLVETYETEILKVVSVWSMFADNDLEVRPSSSDIRGRSVHEQMVHQCVSEDLWFRNIPRRLDRVSAGPLARDTPGVHNALRRLRDAKTADSLREAGGMVGGNGQFL